MTADPADPMESFVTWLPRRVRQAVEAGEFAAPRAKFPKQSCADAVRDIAVELQMPIERGEAGLAALEAHPRVIRELLMCRIAPAWLEAQRKAYRQQHETR